MYGSEKKVRNSVLTEFRKHPSHSKRLEQATLDLPPALHASVAELEQVEQQLFAGAGAQVFGLAPGV
jgi:hypothetical protein